MSLKIGAVGLGRLGYKHAENLACNIPGVSLNSLCDTDARKLQLAAEKWEVPSTYTCFEEMIEDQELDAVVLTSPSSQHVKQISLALDAGLHVFCEKPLGTSLEECKIAEAAVERHPSQVFMLGFMRRYDASYAYAKRRIDAGEIGRPILFRGYSQDPESTIAGTLAYCGHSGGAFIDMSVHDIDLACWMLRSTPTSVTAIGGCYLHPEFGRYKDGDNVSALMQFNNEAMVFLFAGRTAPHGYNVETEIIGTQGILRIGSVPQKNLVEILDANGVRRECSQDFLERFDEAYRTELVEFVSCIQTGRKPEVTVYDGTRATAIAYQCRASFEKGQTVHLA